MCGIAGVLSRDPKLRSREIVGRMLAAIRHRGPDDEGIETGDLVTLGARRLSIIDLAGGHQPMASEDGSVLAIQNGELYNFEELRAQLAVRGHAFRTQNDTEVLPHAWEEWGEDLVPRLRGMFAIAVWDARSRTLLLARDRFGKKPLMYARDGDAIIFASEIQALLTHPSVGRDVDVEAVDDYLTLGYVPAPRTGFSAIRKLPAGHTMVVRGAGDPAVSRYWTIRHEPKLDITLDEACEEVRRRVDEAVRVRLMSDVPLGAFLSGGLDSSTVVAYMARHSTQPVKTFSIGFRDSYFDESRYARVVARAFGTDHHELVVDADDAAVLPMLVRHLGEPFADSSIVPTYHVARITRPHVTVVLNGDGGDELFAGYDRYRAAAIARNVIGPLPGPAARLLSGMAAAVPLWRGLPRVAHRARRFVVALGEEPEERHLRWSGYFTRELRHRIAGERLRTTGSTIAYEQLARAGELTAATDISERYMASDILWYLPDDLLVKMDIATMACSLEARSPLLDHELHEFVARLPISYKLSLRTSKMLLRRAMRGIVPDEILDRRRKMGFSAPVGAWLRGPLRELFGDTVLSSQAADRGFVSPEGVRSLFAEHSDGRADRTMHLWNLLMLELWFREVVDRPAAERNVVPATISA